MSLVAWWPLDGNLKDYCGNRDLKSTLEVIDNNGKIGKCYSFDGNCQRKLFFDDFPQIKDSFSWCCYVYQTDSTGGRQFIISQGRDSGSNYGINITTYLNKLCFFVGNSLYEITYDILNKWTHICITCDKNYVNVYINGSFHSSFNKTYIDFEQTTNKAFVVGKMSYAYTNTSYYFPFKGKINDIRIFDHCLSKKEVSEISKAKILHYSFNNPLEEPTTNYIIGDFSRGLTSCYYIEDGTTLSILDDNFAPIGNKILKIVSSRNDSYTAPYNGLAGKLSDAAPNETWTVSAWLKGELGGEVAQFFIFPLNSSNNYFSPQSNSMTLTKSWKRYSFTITMPANTTGIATRIDNDISGKTIYVSGWQLEKKSYATEYTNGERNYIVSDGSGFRNHGSINIINSPTWVTNSGAGSGSFYFKNDVKCSNGQYQHIYSSNNIRVPEQGTISFFIKHDGVANGDNKYAVGFRNFCSMNNNGIIGLIYYYDGTNYTNNTASSSFYDGKWHMYTITWDSINKKINFYKDGVLVSNQTTSKEFFHVGTFLPFLVGNAWGTNYGGHSGNLDDVRLYATALSSEDISSLYYCKGSATKAGELFINEISEEPESLCSLADIYISNLTTTGATLSYSPNKSIATIKVTTGGNFRFTIPDKLLEDGKIYTVSMNIRYVQGSSGFYFTDFCDVAGLKTISTNNFISITASRSSYSSIYRFIDCNISTDSVVEISNFKIYEGYPTTSGVNRSGEYLCDDIIEVQYKPSLVDYSSWTLNSTPSWYNNGSTSENCITVYENPRGALDLMWATLSNDASSDGDGGFNGPVIDIDKTKKYRFSVWLRRENCGTGSGRSYFGLSAYNSSGANTGVLNQNNLTANTNPYFTNFLHNEIGGILVDNWILLVSYVFPYSTTSSIKDPETGFYNTQGVLINSGIANFQWNSDSAKVNTRAYLYYSTKTDERQYFYRPRIDLCDGTEPSISDLCKCIEHTPLVDSNGVPIDLNKMAIGRNGSIKINEINEF